MCLNTCICVSANGYMVQNILAYKRWNIPEAPQLEYAQWKCFLVCQSVGYIIHERIFTDKLFESISVLKKSFSSPPPFCHVWNSMVCYSSLKPHSIIIQAWQEGESLLNTVRSLSFMKSINGVRGPFLWRLVPFLRETLAPAKTVRDGVQLLVQWMSKSGIP